MIVLEIIAARQDLVLRNINMVTMEVVLGESPTTIPLILAPKYDVSRLVSSLEYDYL